MTQGPIVAARGQNSEGLVVEHEVHAEALAGTVHEPHVEWHGRQAPAPIMDPAAEPKGQAARQRPPCNMGDELLVSQPVHEDEPGPSQLAHVGSHAVQVPLDERNSPLSQLEWHWPSALSTCRIHGVGRLV